MVDKNFNLSIYVSSSYRCDLRNCFIVSRFTLAAVYIDTGYIGFTEVINQRIFWMTLYMHYWVLASFMIYDICNID